MSEPEKNGEKNVGRVSPLGRNPTDQADADEDVGLRDKAANPPYGASPTYGSVVCAWKRTSLREAGVSLIDCDHRTPTAADSGYPYVAIPQIKQGRLDLSHVRYISPAHFVEWTRKAKPQHHDVILSRRCNPGETAYVPAGIECALGQNLVLLHSDATKVFPQFLRWLVRGPDWWEQVNTFINVGAIFDSLKCADIPNFKLSLPPLAEQRAIAHILGTLDDKIELNRRMNETLEAIARAIFKSWFVDFDPVRAKANGEPPESIRRLGLTPDLLALFPARLVDSELGEIPEGWGVGAFHNCCDRIESGGTPSRSVAEYWNGTIRWLTSGEVRDVIVLDTKEKITDAGLKASSAKVWPKGATVVAMYGATAGQICLLAEEMTANQACCALIPKPEFASYVFLAARGSIAQLSDKASGSAQQNLNKSLVANHQLIIPELSVANAFEKLVSCLIEKWISNQREGVTFATLRDTLLPKLLSGELRVPADDMAMEAMI